MSSFYLEDGIEVCYYLDQYEEADESTGSPEVFTFEYELKMSELFTDCKSREDWMTNMLNAQYLFTFDYKEEKIQEMILKLYNNEVF